MVARRRSQSELPNAPLELLHPFALPGAEIPGAEILREVSGPDGAILLELLRAVLAWGAHPKNEPDFATAAFERAEMQLLSRGPDAFGSPAGLLAGYMAEPEKATQRNVAWACVCISDWASERGARSTALQFAQAAAFAWPRQPRYAWMVARMLRALNRLREAEAWFRRAHRVAIWSDDWEAQTRTLSSLGNLYLTIGRMGLAKRLHMRALRLTRRKGEKALEGEVCHDLFVVHAEAGDWESAEEFASQAFTAYGPAHVNLPMLVHDVAQFWAEIGYTWRALPIFRALTRRRDLPYGGIREFAGAARVSAEAGDAAQYDGYAERVYELLSAAPPDVAAAALYLLGIGCERLERTARAQELVEVALELAEKSSSTELITRCDAALLRLSKPSTARAADIDDEDRRELDDADPGDLLAWRMAEGVSPLDRGGPSLAYASVAAAVVQPSPGVVGG